MRAQKRDGNPAEGYVGEVTEKGIFGWILKDVQEFAKKMKGHRKEFQNVTAFEDRVFKEVIQLE